MSSVEEVESEDSEEASNITMAEFTDVVKNNSVARHRMMMTFTLKWRILWTLFGCLG